MKNPIEIVSRGARRAAAPLRERPAGRRGLPGREMLRELGVLTREPGRLGRELRESSDPLLRKRRAVIGLAFSGAAAMQVIALYQTGSLRHVPEPDLPGLDADEVDASDEAYQLLSVGDGFVGLVSYSLTALLAAMGPVDRARRAPWLPLALAAKTLADAAQAARLTRDQWTKHRAFCSWCLLAATATFVALPLTWPEAQRALGHLRGGKS